MHYTPLASYSIPERNPLNPPVRAPAMASLYTISPVTGELMVPGNAGVVIQADSGKEAIRVGGTAMTSNMTLPGFETTLNQIQFYSNDTMVSAFDQNGLYFSDSKSVFIGNQTSYGQLTYTSGSGLTLNSNTGSIALQQNGVTRSSVTSTGLIGVRPPQVATFGSGSGSYTYTPPVGAVYIFVECWGAGGGGSGSANSTGSPTIGGAGGASSVTNTTGPVIVAAANGAGASGYFGDGGTGGAGTVGDIIISGGTGEGGRYTGPYAVPTRGGSAARCPGAGGVFYLTASIGPTSVGGFGAGGGGGWVTGQSAYSGGSGGGGGYAAKYYTIATPNAPPSFTIVIGAGGAAGVNGTGLAAAQPSAGGPGLVIITAYF